MKEVKSLLDLKFECLMPHYLYRVTFPQCHVGVSTVTNLSLLENLFNLKNTREVHGPLGQLRIIKIHSSINEPEH